jgi:uncharacterized protein YbjT (DUF2867 family)
MKVILFGATGMVGQGVLRECFLDPEVRDVLAVGRTSTGQKHEKLRELVHANLFDYSSLTAQLTGFDACFFCLGISSVGMTQQDYERITYDLTLAAAQALVQLNPQMTFIYVSGAGTDSTEQGSSMWARVKGRTENALLRLPFKAAYMFRPGFIQPLHGVKSKTRLYSAIYAVVSPLYPLLKRAFPRAMTTTEQVGKAMINAVRRGAPKRVLEVPDINAL